MLAEGRDDQRATAAYFQFPLLTAPRPRTETELIVFDKTIGEVVRRVYVVDVVELDEIPLSCLHLPLANQVGRELRKLEEVPRRGYKQTAEHRARIAASVSAAMSGRRQSPGDETANRRGCETGSEGAHLVE